MINDFRTLLKNITGRIATQSLSPLAEPSDPTFQTRLLPAWLVAGHAALFGNLPESFYLDYRLRELIQLIAGTPLADGLTARDPRMTEEPFTQPALQTFFTPVLEKIADNAAHTLTLGSNLYADDSRGRSWYRYALSLASSTLTLTAHTGQTYTAAANNGVCQLTAPNGLVINVAPTSGSASWAVTGYTKPRQLGEALKDFEAHTAPWFDAMVPYTQTDAWSERLRAVWTQTPAVEYPRRMAALLLAVAWYINTLPEKGA